MNYTDFRDQLKDELAKRLASIDYSESTLEAYDKDNWAYRQAHKNGQRSTIRIVLQIIEHLDQKEKTE